MNEQTNDGSLVDMNEVWANNHSTYYYLTPLGRNFLIQKLLEDGHIDKDKFPSGNSRMGEDGYRITYPGAKFFDEGGYSNEKQSKAIRMSKGSRKPKRK